MTSESGFCRFPCVPIHSPALPQVLVTIWSPDSVAFRPALPRTINPPHWLRSLCQRLDEPWAPQGRGHSREVCGPAEPRDPLSPNRFIFSAWPRYAAQNTQYSASCFSAYCAARLRDFRRRAIYITDARSIGPSVEGRVAVLLRRHPHRVRADLQPVTPQLIPDLGRSPARVLPPDGQYAAVTPPRRSIVRTDDGAGGRLALGRQPHTAFPLANRPAATPPTARRPQRCHGHRRTPGSAPAPRACRRVVRGGLRQPGGPERRSRPASRGTPARRQHPPPRRLQPPAATDGRWSCGSPVPSPWPTARRGGPCTRIRFLLRRVRSALPSTHNIDSFPTALSAGLHVRPITASFRWSMCGNDN